MVAPRLARHCFSPDSRLCHTPTASNPPASTVWVSVLRSPFIPGGYLCNPQLLHFPSLCLAVFLGTAPRGLPGSCLAWAWPAPNCVYLLLLGCPPAELFSALTFLQLLEQWLLLGHLCPGDIFTWYSLCRFLQHPHLIDTPCWQCFR